MLLAASSSTAPDAAARTQRGGAALGDEADQAAQRQQRLRVRKGWQQGEAGRRGGSG